MADNLETPDPTERRSPWLEVWRVVFIVALAVALFWLGESMVQHRFFRGGRIDRHGVLRP